MPNNNRSNLPAFVIIGGIAGGIALVFAGYRLKSIEPVYIPVQGVFSPVFNTSTKMIEVPDPVTGGTIHLGVNTAYIDGKVYLIDPNKIGVLGVGESISVELDKIPNYTRLK